MTSLYTLMGLSVERWLIITRPGKWLNFINVLRAAFAPKVLRQ
jgi:hypothetical protein